MDPFDGANPPTFHSLRQRLASELGCFLPAEEAVAESWLWFEEGLGRSRAWMAGHGGDPVAAGDPGKLAGWLERRRKGEPWAYIHGSVLWRGRRFQVTRDTLIPRPETELLLEAALEVGGRLGVRQACDLGTGTGILAISLALETDWTVTATDLSSAALAVARANAEAHRAKIRFSEGNLLAPLPDPVGLVVSNPPYVDPDDRATLQPELAWEPEAALFAGEHGLSVATELLRQARQRRAPGVLLEIGAGQGPELRTRAAAFGWRKLMIHKDLAGHDRVLVALP